MRRVSAVSRYPKPLRWAVLSATGGPMDKSFLKQPLRLQVARRVVFQNGSVPVDLFHPGVPFEYIDKVFAIMALCPQHTFQIVTRHAEHLRDYFHKYATRHKWGEAAIAFSGKRDGFFGTCDSSVCDCTYPLPNVWLGVRASNQLILNERLPHLLATPAAVRFVQFCPLVGPVDVSPHLSKQPFFDALGSVFGRVLQEEAPRVPAEPGIDWVIVGGEKESDVKRDLDAPRPLHPAWVRSLRDDAHSSGIPFCFEGWGEWIHESQTDENLWKRFCETGNVSGNVNHHSQFGGYTYRVGAESAGRLIDGCEWQQMPGTPEEPNA